MSFINRVSFRMMAFYHETLYGMFRDPYEVLEAAGLQEGQNVLEVGCGPGFFTIPAAEIVGDEGGLQAIDINPVAVEYVKEKIKDSSINNVKVKLENAAQTEFPAEEFDLVFVFGLARVKEGSLDEVWGEVARILKPDGVLSVEGRVSPPEKLFKSMESTGRVEKFYKDQHYTVHEEVGINE